MVKKTILRLYQDFTVKRIKSTTQGPPDVDQWMSFVNGLPKADDSFSKSYNKYLCRRYFLDLLYLLVMQVSAFFLLFPSWLKAIRQGKKAGNNNSSQAVLVQDQFVGYKDIFPQELQDKFKNIVVIKREDVCPGLYGNARKKYRENYKRRPFDFYYNYLILRELSFYSALSKEYSPEAIIVYVNERNIASPLIKEMLEEIGIEWISFMHGDYLLQLIQAFMSFSVYYVWDKHYIDIFQNLLQVDCGEYRIYTPKKLQHHFDRGKKQYDVVYYLGIENKKRMTSIAFALDELEKRGWKYKVRPHPRSSDMNLVNLIFAPEKIEDTTRVTSEESLCSTRYAASLNSTMLMQAYYGGVKVLIDDYSDRERYNNLEKRKYIMLDKEHSLLSEFINKEKAEEENKDVK